MVVTNHNIRWDKVYDVIVLGFGAGGASAARFAADNGAKVLLVDSAPKGQEGGNTRLSDQFLASGNDPEKLKAYHKAMAEPFSIDDAVMTTFTDGLYHMKDYVAKYFNEKPFSFRENYFGSDIVRSFIEEFDEFPGSDAYDLTTVHEGFEDAALWKDLRKAVTDRSDKIDVWFSSPGCHLIQDKNSNAIVGAQIKRENILRNVKAKNGVVVATGGFENNEAMMQDYLQEPYLQPIGTLYNNGDGVKMEMEVGADLWNMRSYESLGIMHGLSLKAPKHTRGKGTTSVVFPTAQTGSIILVGDNGTRYIGEDMINRHGHVNIHGTWRIPFAHVSPYIIFDQTKADEFKANWDKDNTPGINPPKMWEEAEKFTSVEEMAQVIGKDPEILQNTIDKFNHFANEGIDYEWGRKNMRAFDDGPYYAVAVKQNMLNTQGGGRKNARSEVLDPTGVPIPHLYEAGELGALFVNNYAGGGNLAEALIFGKIAGENAAKIKTDLNEETSGEAKETFSDFKTESDTNKIKEDYPAGPNQYIGHNNNGIGGEIVVRVTLTDERKIEAIEILKEHETEHGTEALAHLPQQMVAHNSFEVDTYTGASVTSWALKDAVKDALSKAAIK